MRFFFALLASLLPITAERPNVVLIITDDQNDYALAGSGVDLHTPALDAFKKSAITFEKAYCAAPVCTTSRAALFSGLFPHRTGAYLNGCDPWNDSDLIKKADAMPKLFRKSGYTTWGAGKLFHAPKPSEYESYWDNKAPPNGGFGPFAEKKFQLAGKFFSVQEWDGPDEEFPDVKSANQAIAFLRKHSSQEDSRPFFMVYGLWRPHNPWTAPRRFFDHYDPSEIAFPPPGYRKRDLDDVPQTGHRLAGIFGSRWKGFGDSNPDAWRRIMHGYLACTSFADWNIGRVIESIDELGLTDNTLIVVTSDNGYHLGEKLHYGKSTLWEDSARVPLWVRLPGKQQAGKTCPTPVSQLDLFPTLVELCRLDEPSQKLDGHSLLPQFNDPSQTRPQPAITTYGEGLFSLRNGRYRFIQYEDGAEELYDHGSDPHEFENLAEDPATENLRATFRRFIPKTFAKSLGGRNG